MRVLRGGLYLAVSAALSWHFLLRAPSTAPSLPQPPAKVELAVAPSVVPPAPAVQPEPEPEPEPEPAPPPPERGDPDGDEDEESTDPVPAPEKEEKSTRRAVEEIRASEEDVARAAEEVSGKTRKGFRTVLASAAGDQLAIARYFGETLVLVPRAGLDPRRPHYYRIDAGGEPGVTRIDGKPPLDAFRQYRDFFAFEYADLPPAVRTLRRKVPVRQDVYLFAALIPPSEWAVVMARRAAALDAAGRAAEDLRRVEMRYEALPGGGFDIEVTRLVFADGTRWTRHPED